MNKFYNFKNETETSTDLYVYGVITNNKESDLFSSESDVDLKDFKTALENIIPYSTLNIYVNSPGGSVFAASTMCSMLQRAKESNHITIKAFIDGLAASAASFLIMVADEINLYSNSMLMIHKPLSVAYGNVNDLQKEIDTLNSIEDNVMIPLYEKKAKCNSEKIKELIGAESWLSATDVDNFFNVNLLSEAKECTACIDNDLFKRYKNVPEEFKNQKSAEETPIEDGEIVADQIANIEEEPKQQEIVEEHQDTDYSYFDNKLNSIKGGN